MTSILEKVNLPEDVKGLNSDELIPLCEEIRKKIISSVSETGGHLGANLGVVEITTALMRVFDPPTDKIVFDTSHQCYTYKILTGRKDKLHTLRQHDGLSGFLNREESKYDAFGAGHAGTALSAALGMAAARDVQNEDHHVIAIVGDAAIGNGISFEALNNVTEATKKFIVILNDNEMSISANVGALSKYLGGLLANPRYNRRKRSVESFARKMKLGIFRSAYYRIEETLKSLFLKSVIFEEFGLRYIGPVDGHNIYAMEDALRVAKEADRPILLHVSTTKGKGYSFAEQDQEKWHGTPKFEIKSGNKATGSGVNYSTVFGNTIEKLAQKDKKLVAITAAMPAGTGLDKFAKSFPDRFYDVGIAEEHATVFAAGLAAAGLHPVFAVYSSFMQRAADCLIHDICLQDLPVTICLDRAGIVGDDGPTHHGVFDIALLRHIPRLIFMQPADEAELANMLYTAVNIDHPTVIRYPRGCGTGATVPDELEKIAIGKAVQLSEGSDVIFWALGNMIQLAEKAAALLNEKGISAGVVNARFIRPLDKELLTEHCKTRKIIATIEGGIISGGFGESITALANSVDFNGHVLNFGWPDEFITHGNPSILMEQYGLTPEKIVEKIVATL
ncbi:MAG: 1-deoxy-D-xylulose-5-phosphate synthase [Kiritimatiellae bacterium]|nr:1-deoxy-D-xylulose-5-phosphate synthase [Kiritimatiellia bacterium]